MDMAGWYRKSRGILQGGSVRVAVRSFLAHAAGVLLGLTVITVAMIVYLAVFDKREPLEMIYSHPVTVEKPARSRADIVEKINVAPGDTFYSYREYCVIHGYRVLRNERRLVRLDGDHTKDISLPLLPSRTVRGVGDCPRQTFPNEMPPNAQPGEYVFTAEWYYTLNDNPIATLAWPWPPVRINVVAK